MKPDPGSIPVVPWSQFWPMFCERYGVLNRDNAEHVTILGPNGTGKSALAMRVADLRPWVHQLIEKPRDIELQAALKRRGYVKTLELPDATSSKRKVYVWPPAGDVTDEAGQRTAFRSVLRQAGKVGAWHGVIHETPYLVDPLGLAPELKFLLRMGRSNGAGLILCAQRPAWLPRDIYSAASHLFIFGTNDETDLRSIGGLNGMSSKLVRETVASLPRDHRFLYVGTKDGTLAISRAPKGF